MKKILLSLAALASFGIMSGQQVIGEFPIMDGGMEAQEEDDAVSSAGSSQGTTMTPQTEWTVSSTGGSSVRDMTNAPTLARSGNFSFANAMNSDRDNGRMQSPSTQAPGNILQTDTQYTVQFFYSSPSDPGTFLRGGIYLNNTTGSNTSPKTDVTAWSANTYTKTYSTVTTGSNFNASHWAVARVSTDADGEYTDTVRIDDFVVYSGEYDDTAPDAPTGTEGYTVSGSDATVAWTAPATGVDGGGYVVVKYASTPDADNDINQNGIYQVGNTTTNGPDALEGTVVYIGTETSFVDDAFTTGAEYKVYTADKAFNYSDELVIVENTLSTTDFSINGTTLEAFPVPMANQLTISGVDVDSATVYALTGAVAASSAGNSVDVSALGAGLYILQIEVDGKTTSTKVMKF